MNKPIIIILLCFSFLYTSAQTENNENTSDEEVIYYMPAPIENDVIPKASASPASKNFLKQGNNRKLYKVKPLYKNFDWIQTKKNRKTGVIKDGKIFLPMVFDAEIKQKGNPIILSHNRQHGVYDLELDKWIIPTISDWIVKLNPDLFAVRLYDGLFYLVNSKNEIIEKTNWVRFDKSSINPDHYIVKTNDYLFGLYDKKLKKIIVETNHQSFKIEKRHYAISKNGFGKNLLSPDGIFLFDDWVQDIEKVIDPNTGKRPNYYGGLDKNFDYYIVRQNGKKGLVRSDSKVVIPFKYQNILFRAYFWSQNEAGKWGVINNEKIIIPFKYNEISRLRNARTNKNIFYLLKVRVGNKYGLYQYNQNTLNLLADCKYKNIRIEGHGVIVQDQNDKYQLINYDTKKPVFKTKKNAIIQSYQNSFLVNDKNNWSLVNSAGIKRTKKVYKEMQNFHFYIVAKNASGKFGILSNKGKTILPFEYEDIFTLDEENSGSNANIFIIKKAGKLGLFHGFEKKIKTEIIYDNAFKDSQYIYLTKGNDFFQARAFGRGDVQKRENFVPSKKEIDSSQDIFIVNFTPGYEIFYGLFNFKINKWLIPLGQKHLVKIKEDLFLIQKGNQPVLFVNSKGKHIKKTDWVKFDKAKQIKNKQSHYYFKNEKGFFGVYDAINDKEIIPAIYDEISIDNNVKDHYFLKKDGKTNYVDFEGNRMFPDDIENVKRSSTSSNLQFFTFTKNGKKGIIRADGKIITSENYTNLKFISNTMWLQNSTEKWGIFNEEKDEVSFEYDEFKSVKSKDGKDYYQVKKDGKLAIFIKEKDSFTQFFDYKYESIEFLQHLIIVGMTSGYRFLNYSKKDIFEKEFQAIRKFHKNYFVQFENQWSLVNSKGEKIIEENFEDLDNFPQKNSTQYDKKYYTKYKAANQKTGLLDARGEKLTEPIFDDIVYRLNGFIMVKNGEKLRWYNPFKNEYASEIEFDYFSDNAKNVYCLSKDKWYYTGKFSDKFYLMEMKLPSSVD